MHRVRTQLKGLTGKEVKISKLIIIIKNACLLILHNNADYLDKVRRHEATIEYLVKDEPGALAKTLEIISVSSIMIVPVL